MCGGLEEVFTQKVERWPCKLNVIEVYMPWVLLFYIMSKEVNGNEGVTIYFLFFYNPLPFQSTTIAAAANFCLCSTSLSWPVCSSTLWLAGVEALGREMLHALTDWWGRRGQWWAWSCSHSPQQLRAEHWADWTLLWTISITPLTPPSLTNWVCSVTDSVLSPAGQTG